MPARRVGRTGRPERPRGSGVIPPPARGGGRGDPQIVEVQNLQREVSGAFASLQRVHAFVGADGAGGASLISGFPTQETTSATTMNTITALISAP